MVIRGYHDRLIQAKVLNLTVKMAWTSGNTFIQRLCCEESLCRITSITPSHYKKEDDMENPVKWPPYESAIISKANRQFLASGRDILQSQK